MLSTKGGFFMKKVTVTVVIWVLALAGSLVSNPAHADQVIADDLIVQGGACVGVDCVNGENFDFVTIRLKENNLRIRFEDTSSIAWYPTTDWQITVNDSAIGGRSYFGIDNVDSGNPVLRIYEGVGAPVVIGEGSTYSGDNTMSVGSTGNERRITNVAAGTAGTDAVNVSQLNSTAAATLSSANNYTDISIAAISGNLNGSIAVDNTSGYADPSATGADSVAAGGGAVASAPNTVAVGSNARATGTNAIAIGAGSLATGSVAVGTGATASNGGSAFGDYATATGTASVAVGQGATSTGSNSVAIGSDSTDGGESNVVSVGSSGNERRVTNVADGINDSDSANMGQLRQATAAIQNDVLDLRNRIGSLESRLDDLGAVASAFSALVPNARSSGNTQISLGTGYYNGSAAVAAGVFHYVNNNVLLNTGVSTAFNSRSTSGRAGITFGW
jgi:autotransporter adhesin